MEGSAADRPRRVDVGFAGGQVLTLRLTEAVHAGLNQALHDESARWHEVATEDSSVLVDLSQVVYVRLDTEQHRVGFSTGA
jgi:hypothetical protein